MLNNQQAAVAETLEGNLIVNAGAGTGKTHTLTTRFVHALSSTLESENPITPDNILAITYTNAAAAELKLRVQNELRNVANTETVVWKKKKLITYVRKMNSCWISTFHSFGSRVLRIQASTLGLDPSFRLMEEDETTKMQKEVLESFYEQLHPSEEMRVSFNSIRDSTLQEAIATLQSHTTAEVLAGLLNLGKKRPTIRENIQEIVDTSNKFMIPLSNIECEERNGETSEQYGLAILEELLVRELAIRFAEEYRCLKAKGGLLDFSDLITHVSTLFSEHPKVASDFRSRFKIIMIDEFQDTNRVQLELFKKISDTNLCTVGDEKQSIFGFQGADISVIQELGDAGKGDMHTQVVDLNVNYRSHANILQLINEMFQSHALIGGRYSPIVSGKDIDLGEAKGPQVRMTRINRQRLGAEPGKELALVAQYYSQLHEQGIPLSDMVVLVRNNAHLDLAVAELNAHKLKAVVWGGKSFFAEPAVREVVSFLMVIRNPNDDKALASFITGLCARLDEDTLLSVGQRRRHDKLSGVKESLFDTLCVAANKENESSNLTHFVISIQRAQGLIGMQSLGATIEQFWRDRGVFDLYSSSGEDGLRQWANVRRIIAIIDTLEGQGNNIVDIIEYVNKSITTGKRESVGVWPHKTTDAVRVMTIHRSKGLEFPNVALLAGAQYVNNKAKPVYANMLSPDDAKLFDSKVSPKVSAMRKSMPAESVIFLPTCDKDKDAKKVRDEYKKYRIEKERQEFIRLLYVGCTRAEQRLMITYIADPKNGGVGGLIDSALASQGARGDGKTVRENIENFVEFREYEAEDVISLAPQQKMERFNTVVPAPIYAIDQVSTQSLDHKKLVQASYSQMAMFNDNFAEYDRKYNKRQYVASKVEAKNEHKESLKDEYEGETSPGDNIQVTASATLGNAVHKILEVTDDAVDDQRARNIASSFGLNRAQQDEAIANAQAFVESELYQRVLCEEVRYKEWQFYVPLQDGEVTRYLTGYIDCIAVSREKDVLIVDYKVSSATNILKKYAIQAKLYALVALTWHARRVEVVFAGLHEGVMTEYPHPQIFTQEDIESLRAEIRKIMRDMEKSANSTLQQ